MRRAFEQQKICERGFVYVALLISVALLAALGSGLVRLGLTMQRHEAEQELLERGYEMTLALESYQRATPSGMNPKPHRLDDLLRDPRFPKSTIRHLRKINIDPITGKTDWVTVLSDDGTGIVGFHSASNEVSSRKEFQSPFIEFNQKEKYSDWIFGGSM